jgi:hypothetical protein
MVMPGWLTRLCRRFLGAESGRQEANEYEKLDRWEPQIAFPHLSGVRHTKPILFMPFVRRRLPWVIGAWLLCQVAGVAAAPLTFCCQNVATSADDEECCPGLLPGQVCPMHHAKEGERTCKMRSTCTKSDAALVSLAGGIGVVPVATPLVSSFVVGEPVRHAPTSAIARAYRPESPPPRS